MELNDIARFTIKDTVFRDLFKDKKYLLELYRALHPENTSVTEDDIEPITLEAVLMADLYNDVGFRVKNELFVLVEAQTTWTMNILIRMFMYLAESYNNYFTKEKQSLYSSKKVSFPKPELYVIYTGDRGNKKDTITLSEEFLNGEECSLEVKARVIFEGSQGDIINQYIRFTRVYQEQLKAYGRTRRAVIETIKICKNSDVLADYLEKREQEVVTIMMSLFDTEHIFNTYVESEKREAKAQGEVKGEIKATIKMCKEFGISVVDTIKRLMSNFGLTENDAKSRVMEYWNQ
jgi:hypothetical protein